MVQKEYTCEDQQHTIPKKDVCNGYPDCPDASDEMYCNGVASEYEEHAATSGSKVTVPGPRPTIPTIIKNVTMVVTRMTTRFSPTLHSAVTKTFPRILSTVKPLLPTPRPKNINKKGEDYFYEE